MVANVTLIAEREFGYPQKCIFKAWTVPGKMMLWQGSPEWRVEQEMVSPKLELGGKHRHVKIRDNDSTVRVTTNAVFTEYFGPDVFVTYQRITGDPGIDPDIPMEPHVEFAKYGGGTLMRIIQGPCESSRAEYHATGWEQELDHLKGPLTTNPEGISR